MSLNAARIMVSVLSLFASGAILLALWLLVFPEDMYWFLTIVDPEARDLLIQKKSVWNFWGTYFRIWGEWAAWGAKWILMFGSLQLLLASVEYYEKGRGGWDDQQTEPQLVAKSHRIALAYAVSSIALFLISILYALHLDPKLVVPASTDFASRFLFALDVVVRGAVAEVFEHFDAKLSAHVIDHRYAPIFSGFVFCYRNLCAIYSGYIVAAGIFQLIAAVKTYYKNRQPPT